MPALLERDAQRAELDELLRDLAQGRGSLLLVEGPAGIGKTEVLRLAHSMARGPSGEGLQGKGGELEREFPFGVVRQLFEPAVVRATQAQREQLFTGAAVRARPVLDHDRPDYPGAPFFNAARTCGWKGANRVESAAGCRYVAARLCGPPS